MKTDFSVEELYRPSASGEHDIYSVLYIPEHPVGALQIAHGMAEHSGRYREFASYLASHGWVVALNDHLGHGKSANEEPGVFTHREGHGFDYVLRDMRTLFLLLTERFPACPQFLLGHSMGSILAALYGEEYGLGLRGLILMGTPAPNRAASHVLPIASMIRKRKGDGYVSPLLVKLTSAGMTAPDTAEHGPHAWLSHNLDSIREYDEDPLCGFPFTVGANEALIGGLAAMSAPQWGEHIPMHLDCLVIAGKEDTCGGKGKGPKAYYKQLKNHGVEDVTLKLIPDARHEVLNELNREDTYAYLLAWLTERVGMKKFK